MQPCAPWGEASEKVELDVRLTDAARDAEPTSFKAKYRCEQASTGYALPPTSQSKRTRSEVKEIFPGCGPVPKQFYGSEILAEPGIGLTTVTLL
jgi:hypothetical protein